MAPKPYDLAVAYRIYPLVSKVPPIFPDDKYRLASVCLESFRQSLGSLRVKIWVLLDGCPAKYQRLFESHFEREDLELRPLDRIGNGRTFGQQVEILCEQSAAELVYFAEDDYFYLPEQLEIMCQFARENPRADFVTPYDHPNAYSASDQGDPEYIVAFGGRHWRTIVSSCLTFLTSRSTLRRSRVVFESFVAGNSDYALWMSLTKYPRHVFDPRRYRLPGSKEYVFRMWEHSWRQMLFGKRYRLWSPMPSIATHMESAHLAPVVEWQRLWRN